MHLTCLETPLADLCFRTLLLQADKIQTLITAAGVECEAIWATLLAKALEGKDVKELLSNVGAGGGAPAAAVPAGGAPAAAAAEEKKEEPKAEEKEESDEDMVRIVFTSLSCAFINHSYHVLRASGYSINHWSLMCRTTTIPSISCDHMHCACRLLYLKIQLILALVITSCHVLCL